MTANESDLRKEVADLRQRLADSERAQAQLRRTETALRESERRLATLLSNLPGMAYRCRNDADWTMEFVSEGCKPLTGHDAADIIDNRVISWNLVVHTEDRLRVHEEVRQAIDRSRPFEIIYRIFTVSGGKKWVWERGIGIVDDGGRVQFIEGFITDISERIHVERELSRRVEQRTAELAEANRQLQESLDEVRAIHDAVADGLIIVDVETGECVRSNEQMARMLGYTLDDLPCDPASVHRPEHLPELAEKFAAQAQGHLSLAENIPFLHKDGHDVYTDVSGAPTVYRGRRCLVCFVRDVTQRRIAEDALRQSEARYRGLVEASPDAVVMTDLTGQVVLASQQLWRLLSLPADTEIAGRSVFEFVVEQEQLAANLQDVIEKGVRKNSEYTARRADGTTVPVEASSSVVRSIEGRPIALLSIIRDVSDRRQAEEARRASENRFQAIFDEAPVGMVIANPDRTIARVNKAMCEISGYAPDELIGHHVEQFMHPDDRDISAPHVEKLLAGEIPSFTVERRYLAKGGRPFWAQATTATICGADGKLAFGLGIVEDIDDRKKAEQELERERKTLLHMLRSSDHERRLIAYDIHDGLAQQLAAASMQFQAYEHLKRQEPASAKTAFDAGVQMLRQAHCEARRLISGVRPPILDESGIVAALAHLVHDQQAAAGPSIEFQSDVEFRRLEPILENAAYRIAQEGLANAVGHSRSPRVRLALIQSDRTIQIEVQDWGIGFDTETVSENRFGLQGIRERARLMGGQVLIDSRIGAGTTVKVQLPLILAADDEGRD